MTSDTRRAFERRVDRALGDTALQHVVRNGQDYVHELQERTREGLDWDGLLDRVEAVRTHTIAHLDHYVAEFAANVEKNGGVVYFAATAAEARDYVAQVALGKGVRLAVKTKSMVTEEIALNPALAVLGVEVVETDLGEFIIQLAGEKPFHIITPAIHKSIAQIRDLLSTVAGEELPPEAEALTRFARQTLRQKFLTAELGISGANFGVAATGSIALLTNEGNGRMTTTLPKTHVVVMGVERLVPDLESLEPLLAVLPLAATGARITSYVSIISGPRRADDGDGPEELHVVIVDNGRSTLLGSKYQSVLDCIRCGACLDVCPVYGKIGGHAYGAVYPGPIGAVLNPLLEGLDRHHELPLASSLCGACTEVCSARIPLADLLLELRRDGVEAGLEPVSWRVGMRGYARVAGSPRLWSAGASGGLRAARLVAGLKLERWLPGVLGAWTRVRDLPRLSRHTFRARWAERSARRRDGA